MSNHYVLMIFCHVCHIMALTRVKLAIRQSHIYK